MTCRRSSRLILAPLQWHHEQQQQDIEQHASGLLWFCVGVLTGRALLNQCMQAASCQRRKRQCLHQPVGCNAAVIVLTYFKPAALQASLASDSNCLFDS